MGSNPSDHPKIKYLSVKPEIGAATVWSGKYAGASPVTQTKIKNSSGGTLDTPVLETGAHNERAG